MRSMLHYGCVAYMSAAEIHLQKNWKWSRCMRNMQWRLYGLSSSCHASGGGATAIENTKNKTDVSILNSECWEYDKTILFSFGWFENVKAESLWGLSKEQQISIQISPSWIMTPSIDQNIQQQLQRKSKQIPASSTFSIGQQCSQTA